MSDQQHDLFIPDFQCNAPFELLGVDPSVSARDVKRAYVRLIKRYRPETHPEEFQKLHAAYEQASQAIKAGYAETLWGQTETSTPESPEESVDSEKHEVRSEHEDAPPDFDESALLEELVLFGQPQEEILVQLQEAIHQRDEKALTDLLENEELADLCQDDSYPESLCLTALERLAWLNIDKATELAQNMGYASPANEKEEWDIVGLNAVRQFEALAIWCVSPDKSRAVATGGVLPNIGRAKHLGLKILGREPAVSTEAYDRLACLFVRGRSAANDSGTLLDAVDANSSEYGEIASVVSKYYGDLANYWSALDAIPYEYYDFPLDTLDEQESAEIEISLLDIRDSAKPPVARKFLHWILLLCLLGTGGGILLYWIIRAVTSPFREQRRYKKRVQPALQRLALEQGVGNTLVLAWINSRSSAAGCLSEYDIKIEADQSLDMLASLSRYLRNGSEQEHI
ncbi:MAG: J domain-containing protein [Kofleriaceae bacterium]|nr:J domain-containing protein [Kofleriaceae bacterium]